MAELWDALLACLDLGEASADGAFEGKNLPLDYHRLFGGQLLAQFAAVAAASCPGKSVKSLHALFPARERLRNLCATRSPGIRTGVRSRR